MSRRIEATVADDIAIRLREIAKREGKTIEEIVAEALTTFVLHKSLERALGSEETKH